MGLGDLDKTESEAMVALAELEKIAMKTAYDRSALLAACKECASRLREVLMDVVSETYHTADLRKVLAQTEKAIKHAEGKE